MNGEVEEWMEEYHEWNVRHGDLSVENAAWSMGMESGVRRRRRKAACGK